MANEPILHDPLEQYLMEVNRYPLLTREQEYELALRYQETGDPEAARALVAANLRFVVKIAYQFQNYDIKLTDLVQEGNIGLMKAVRKFKPDRGYRLISYAVWWIKAYIQNYIIQNWSLVRVGPVSQQRRVLFGRRPPSPEAELASGPVRHILADGAEIDQGAEIVPLDDETDNETFLIAAHASDASGRRGTAKAVATGEADAPAADAGPTAEEVEEWRRAAQAARRDMSLDASIGDGGRMTLAETMPSDETSAEDDYASAEVTALVSERLTELHAELNDKELAILEQRLLADEPATLQDVGDRFGISRERVRQIEVNLKKKIARRLEGLAPIALLAPPQ